MTFDKGGLKQIVRADDLIGSGAGATIAALDAHLSTYLQPDFSVADKVAAHAR